jgi:hypothetical protein
MQINSNFKRNTPTQLLMNFNCSAEQLYYDDLPYHPFCTNNFQTEGSYQLRRDLAIGKAIVQHNPNHLIRCLVFDMDKPKGANAYWNAQDHWKDVGAPQPNWIVINPANGNAHYYYMLTTPVPITDNSRIKPRKYVAAIQRALRIKLQADIGYADHLAKNPTHEKWNALVTRHETYSLEELAQYIDLETLVKTPKRESEGLGRHCILFDELRWWAYSRVNSAKDKMNFEQWFNSLSAKAEALNTFNTPLSYSSINSTTKSVARWTWTKYSGKGDSKKRGRDTTKNHQLALQDKQVYAAIKTNEQQIEQSIKRMSLAIKRLKLENKKISQSKVQSISKLGLATIKRHWNHPEIGIIRCTSDNPAL